MFSQNNIKQNQDLNQVTVVLHCDINYAARALALVTSLIQNKFNHKILVFCHDIESYLKLSALNLNQVYIKKVDELEERYPELRLAKVNRSKKEYFYCVTPFLLKYIAQSYRSRFSIYLDSDLFFFSSFDAVLDELEDYSVAITPHRFTPKNKHLEKYGKYNVGLVSFSNSIESSKLLNWWAEQCIKSTSMEVNSGVVGDQKYLDSFEEMVDQLKSFDNPGHNAAPWNTSVVIQIDSELLVSYESAVYKLIYFHFSGLQRLKWINLLGFMPFRVRPNSGLKNFVYRPYLNCLEHSEFILQINKKFKPMELRNFINSLRYRDFIFSSLFRRN
jgi:hypothetical protein